MFSVTYLLNGKTRRKSYQTETAALRSIWKWLKKNHRQANTRAIFYASNTEPSVYDHFAQLPFEEAVTTPFYSSPKWLKLRYQAFELYGNRCACCGATPETGATLEVDHIKPRSSHPELALDIENLQILCRNCNLGKLNNYQTQWR